MQYCCLDVGWSEKKSRAHGTLNKYSSLETGDHEGSQAHSGIPDLASSSTSRQMGASFTEADGEKENAVRLSVEGSEHLSSDPPEQAAEQEEEWEDEEEEEEERGGYSLIVSLCLVQPKIMEVNCCFLP